MYSIGRYSKKLRMKWHSTMLSRLRLSNRPSSSSSRQVSKVVEISRSTLSPVQVVPVLVSTLLSLLQELDPAELLLQEECLVERSSKTTGLPVLATLAV